jgi:nucleotide-binding universal stress UspA family protein
LKDCPKAISRELGRNCDSRQIGWRSSEEEVTMDAPDGSSSETADTRLGERGSVFGSVLVGIDGSPEALEAARQASVLTEGRLVLLAAYDIATPLVGGTGPAVPAYYDEEGQRTEAERTLAQAHGESERLATAEGRIVRGTAWDELIREVEREQHTLVVVGSHGQGRIKGIVLGSTATELVHKAPCPVLVARTAGADFPRRIVVGVDGSPESAAAYSAARRLSERFAAELRPVVAQGGDGADKELVAKIVAHQEYEDLPGEPVQAIVSSAADADLVVVGSRGLHGLKALGSVSERVAHRVNCSALVVRESHG